jgi:DTW domain-containing protein YfiP
VLFLGALKDSQALAEDVPLQIRGRGGIVVPLKTIQGIVLLDGNWKQSKTLWWRNAWLLKLNRILLNPKHSSKYGELRREPRKHCLATIEAAAETLSALGESPTVGAGLHDLFSRFLEKARGSPVDSHRG